MTIGILTFYGGFEDAYWFSDFFAELVEDT